MLVRLGVARQVRSTLGTSCGCADGSRPCSCGTRHRRSSSSIATMAQAPTLCFSRFVTTETKSAETSCYGELMGAGILKVTDLVLACRARINASPSRRVRPFCDTTHRIVQRRLHTHHPLSALKSLFLGMQADLFACNEWLGLARGCLPPCTSHSPDL